MSAFHAVLRSLAKKRGVGSLEISEAIGAGNTTVWEWLNLGVRTHADEGLVKLANYFGVSTDFLLTGKDARGEQDRLVKVELLLMKRENVLNRIKIAELENQLDLFGIVGEKTDREKLNYELMAIDLELDALERKEAA